MSFQDIFSWLLRVPILGRRLLLISVDLLLIPLALWLSFVLRLADVWPSQLQLCIWMLPVAWLVAPSIYYFTGQYKGITRYAGSHAFYSLALRNLAVVVVLLLVGLLWRLPEPPRSSWLLLWLLLTALTGLVRLVFRDLLQVINAGSHYRSQQRAVIYGAGAAGVQLASALRYAQRHRLLAFLDDDPSLWGRHINGIPVFPPHRLPQLVERLRPSQILLALPNLSRSRRRRILEDLQDTGIQVLQAPSVEEITSGRTSISALRPIAIEELLGRDSVAPDFEILGPGMAGKAVLVSGAGGSIGSELCRQILSLAPRCLILLENHEPSLYAIELELRQMPASASVELIGALGSVTDAAMLAPLLRRHHIQIIFHAAAYKHVPIVESWPMAGLANNVFGTLTLARMAAQCGVESFTLISTDKAVRPTNVMGASKRLAEQVIQALAHEQRQWQSNGRPATRFSMVRFGNVLGSSGSVVPLFREQIAAGGPVTLTHPDIIRYFMTIPEAVQLVLQASAMAQGGDLFLLDMGEPVRIADLARQMISLSGLTVCDETHPEGEIEIVCTGLRPGEKLFEELLIGAESQPTDHPLIYRAIEEGLQPSQLWPLLDQLQAALASQDLKVTFSLLSTLVPEWQTSDQKEFSSLPTGSSGG